MKTAGMTALVALAGYVAGAAAGIAAINLFSANQHDRSVEAAMTGIFVVGPVFSAIAAAAYLGKRTSRGRAAVKRTREE